MAEQWLAFIQEKWFIILIAIIAVIVVINVVRTVLKWLFVAVIVAAVVMYGANYKDDLASIGDQVLNDAKEQAFRVIAEQTANAQYELRDDGTFVVSTESLRLEGKEGSDEVTLYWKEIRIGTFQIDATIEAFLEQAKQR
jgi:hypothetical protein